MFELTSRYYAIENETLTTGDGRVITYKRRRLLPRADAMPTLVEVTFVEGDRLDLIAARHLGDPEQFWRVCDASNAMDPFELTSIPGRVLKVPVPQFEEPQ